LCGHLLIDLRDEAPRDSLGKTGSLEAYAGANGVIARTLAKLDAGTISTLSKRREEGEITPLVIAKEAEQGDALARQIIMETARYLALGIVSLIHTIDPDSVVLAGAMTFGGQASPLGREFLERIREEVRPRLLKPLDELVQIQFAELGSNAGYIGAAGLARKESRSEK